jgi:hypothetical protein
MDDPASERFRPRGLLRPGRGGLDFDDGKVVKRLSPNGVTPSTRQPAGNSRRGMTSAVFQA